jgi:myo-inositol 2-dehydrogenase/D-chiro-inositol 1-dehydrogenase
MSPLLRAAVIGAGHVGAIHARALTTHPEVRLVGVCGRTAPKTEALARKHGVQFFLSMKEMLTKTKPDIVCVCTGNKDHLAPALEAIESGAHVFVEKPIAFTVKDARTMIATAENAGVRLGVDFNHRYSGPYQVAQKWFGEGALGRICYLDMKFAGDLYHDLNDSYCQLIETQGHSFDLLRLFGGEIVEIFAFLTDPRAIGSFTSAAVTARFDNGAVGSLLGSWDSSYRHPAAQMLEVSGTEGRLQVENVVDAARLFRHEAGEYSVWKPPLFDTDRRDFWHTIDAHLHAFVDALLRDRPPPVGGHDGLRALEVTFAAIRSFEQRRPIATHT